MLSLVVLLVGLLLGIASTWFVLRSKIDAAVERGRGGAEVEIATNRERLRSLEDERRQLDVTLSKLQIDLEATRQALSVARNEIAQLAERASRLPAIEAELEKSHESERAANALVLRLTKSEAEKEQLLQTTTQRLEEVSAEQHHGERKLQAASTALNDANERLAGAEEKASRIPSLEQAIQRKDEDIATAAAERERLKESVSRLSAELNAEREINQASALRTQEVTQQLAASARALNELQVTVTANGALIGRLEAELASEKSNVASLSADLSAEKLSGEAVRQAKDKLATEYAEAAAQLEAERNQNAEKIELLNQAREQLSLQFKTLANEILEEKTKKFTENNQANMEGVLNPLKERMAEFRSKVEEIHAKDIEQQSMLRSELGQLKDLNRQITEEAHNLATALKGHAKTQGNWGELILGNVLDRAGLCEGKDYRREVSFNTEEGRKRPDVVVSLPQSKHLVIDAKVSLNAYTRYVNEEDEVLRAAALKEHVSAISNRIQELSDRNYFELPGLNTPEIVFMFIPIESAFVEAFRADESLFQRAIANNVLVATPTTLITVLNIVRQLWRFEEQNAHTAELADRAAKVYKKLISFLASMEALGGQLDKAKESYGKAMGQLVEGRANLIQQANDFQRLGVSIQTPLPENLVARAVLELEAPAAIELDAK